MAKKGGCISHLFEETAIIKNMPIICWFKRLVCGWATIFKFLSVANSRHLKNILGKGSLWSHPFVVTASQLQQEILPHNSCLVYQWNYPPWTCPIVFCLCDLQNIPWQWGLQRGNVLHGNVPWLILNLPLGYFLGCSFILVFFQGEVNCFFFTFST